MDLFLSVVNDNDIEQMIKIPSFENVYSLSYVDYVDFCTDRTHANNVSRRCAVAHVCVMC